MCVVAHDATYLRVTKSNDFEFQKDTWSGDLGKGNIVKVNTFTVPNGRPVAIGPGLRHIPS